MTYRSLDAEQRGRRDKPSRARRDLVFAQGRWWQAMAGVDECGYAVAWLKPVPERFASKRRKLRLTK